MAIPKLDVSTRHGRAAHTQPSIFNLKTVLTVVRPTGS
jgi:hypothetical protein